MATDIHDSPEHASETAHRRQVWSSYWQQGSLHSLCGSIESSYDGPIRDFWQAALSTCTPGSRMLDLCTGNGALPKLACDLLGNAMPKVDAVDLAEIAPAWLASAPEACRRSVRFHGGVCAESLPFETHAFALLVSQFGLEYCHLEDAIRELSRVAGPGARIACILHHAQSRLVEVASEEAGLIDWLLHESGPMRAAAVIYPHVALAGTGQRDRLMHDAEAAAARARLNASMRALAQRAAASRYPDVLFEARDFVAGQVNALIQATLQPADAGQKLSDFLGALRDAAFRHRELCHHALTDPAMGRLVVLLRANGFEDIACQPIHHQAYLIGWTLTGRKAN